MKQCQMYISPAPECLVPCPEEATEILTLGKHTDTFLCKEHYKAFNSNNNKNKPPHKRGLCI
jgi:hypothetical protein